MSANRKPGRPRGVRYSIPKHVFLDKEHADLLRKLAAKERRSESDTIRELLRKAAPA